MREVELEDDLGRQALLRRHELQFVAAGQFEVGPGLRTHTDPIESLGGLAGAIGLDGDLEVGCVEGVDQRLVDLKQGFAAGTDDQRSGRLAAVGPLRSDCIGQVGRCLEASSARAVGADDIGVAELADGLVAILLAAGPQVAARKPAEDGGTPGIGAFTLAAYSRFL